MNTDREYCIGLLGVKDGKVVTCNKRYTCKRYIDFKALFRGKRCKDQEWVYGYLVKSHRMWAGFKPRKSWIVDSPMTNGGWFALIGKAAVIEDTLGQFTGLKDKNGKMIFEGDIVRDKSGETGYIGYLLQECGFGIIWKDRDSRLGHRARNSGYTVDANLEIIGNTYDNPELLKEGEK